MPPQTFEGSFVFPDTEVKMVDLPDCLGRTDDVQHGAVHLNRRQTLRHRFRDHAGMNPKRQAELFADAVDVIQVGLQRDPA